MTTRDRTALFLRYREEARALHRRPMPRDNPPHAHPSDEISLSSDKASTHENATIMRVAMEPDWVFAYNDLKDDVAELDKMLDRLATMYAQHLLPSFGEKDTSHLEHEIRILSHRLTDMLHSVEQKVRTVAKPSAPPSSRAPNANDAAAALRSRDLEVERIIRRNVQKRFATPLQKLSMGFRKRQKDYLDKLKQMRDSYGDVDGDGEDEQLVSVPLHDDPHGIRDNGSSAQSAAFSEGQLLAVESSSALAGDRKRELTRVSTNINDLAILVKDIAALVVDQGTVLDRIDYNLEDVRAKTMGATRELRIADRYQRKQHALCCIIILAVGCGIMTMILIYKWTT